MAAIYLLLFLLVKSQCLGPDVASFFLNHADYIKGIIVSPYVELYEAEGLFGKSFGVCISSVEKKNSHGKNVMDIQCHTALQRRASEEFDTRSDRINATTMTSRKVNSRYQSKLRSLLGVNATVKVQEFKGKELKAMKLL